MFPVRIPFINTTRKIALQINYLYATRHALQTSVLRWSNLEVILNGSRIARKVREIIDQINDSR